MKKQILLSALVLGGCAGAGAAVLPFEGITEAIHDVTISAKVAGTIESRPVNEGDPVKAGQVLFEFERDAEKLEMTRRKLLWESKAELNAAATDEEIKQKDYESTKSLAATTGSVSQDDVAAKQLEYVKAKAEHQRLRTVEEREEIEYNIAKEDHDRRVVLSPISGVVAQAVYEAGEDAKAQEPLARVVDNSKILLVVNIDASAGRWIKKGQAVRLQLDSGGEMVDRQGSISFISPVVDPFSGLLRVKAVFDNRDGSVRPGVSGRLLIETP
jgi:RND family efflux transporter MFP subunit